MNELQGKYIFIIEDDMINLSIYSVTLRRTGALVMQDYWNTNSLGLIAKLPRVDVILLDLMLRHGVSGYEIYDKLRSVPALANVPVIAVSAADPIIEISKTKAKGFAGFIGKPINPEKFPAQINACLCGEPVWYIPGSELEDY